MTTEYTEALRDDTVRLAEALADEKGAEAKLLRDIARNAKFAQIKKVRNKVALYAAHAEINFLEGKKLYVLVDELDIPSTFDYEAMGTTDTVPCSLSFDGEVWEFCLPLSVSINNKKMARHVGRWQGYLVKNLLENYKKTGDEIHQIDRPVICFEHTFCEDLPLSRKSDADNRDNKRVLDGMTGILFEDDSLLDIVTVHKGRLGEEEGTKVYVMDEDIFPLWYAKNLIEK